jgi:glucose-1-phosphate thymidylyltransferase
MAPRYAIDLKPSVRGELEITDLNRRYLARGEAVLQRLGRGFAWLDTGTPASMLDAASFIRTVEQRQGLKIACPEEVAYRMGFIDEDALGRAAALIAHTDYGRYLARLVQQECHDGASIFHGERVADSGADSPPARSDPVSAQGVPG